jgi:hypothetical protein
MPALKRSWSVTSCGFEWKGEKEKKKKIGISATNER